MTADELVDALVETLNKLRKILPSTKNEWENDESVRLAVERLWIEAGNTAEAYRRVVDLPTGVEPWAELAGYRNLLAHALPGDVFVRPRVGRHGCGSASDRRRGRRPAQQVNGRFVRFR